MLLEIDWLYSDAHHLECFAAWLKLHRPEKVTAYANGKVITLTPVTWKGAATPAKRDRARLRALGAWRLLQAGLDWTEARLETHEALKKKSLFSGHQSGWSRAKAEAEKWLDWIAKLVTGGFNAH